MKEARSTAEIVHRQSEKRCEGECSTHLGAKPARAATSTIPPKR